MIHNEKKYNILVIDDSVFILDLFRAIIEDIACCNLYLSESFENAKELVNKIKIDLYFIDIVLSETTGYDVCKFFKNHENSVNSYFILMSGEKITLADRIRAFNSGAHEFLPKPFDTKELELIIMRKTQYFEKVKNHDIETKNETVHEKSSKFILNEKTQNLLVEGKEVDLTKAEYELIRLFFLNPGKILNYENISKNAWGSENWKSEESLRRFIHKLRLKLEKDPHNPNFIVSLKGKGYIFYPLGKSILSE